MFQVVRHSAHDYAVLPEIDADDTGTLIPDDLACLDELGDFLVGSAVSQRFGATLLHTHFSLRSSEVMIETVDRGLGEIHLSPREVRIEDMQPIHFRFAGTRERLVGLEYSADLDGVEPVGRQDESAIGGIFEILSRRRMTGRFGVRLLRNSLNLPDSQMLVESCDTEARVLTNRVVDAGDGCVGDSIPTCFSWRSVKDAGTGVRTLTRSTISVCNVVTGCLRRPDGGHETHSSHDPG